MSTLVHLRPSTAPLRCAYCHDQLEFQARRCPECGTTAHFGCWRELQACPTPGCTHRPRTRPEARHARPPTARRMAWSSRVLACAVWTALLAPLLSVVWSDWLESTAVAFVVACLVGVLQARRGPSAGA